MLNVLDWLRSRTPQGRKASELYGSIVALARAPQLYLSAGVPDTPNGRYEMVVLHTAFALQALKRENERGANEGLSRALVERFVTDMDDSLRQLAVGDMSVPRKVKKAAAGLKERAARYSAAAAETDAVAAMRQVLTAHIWPEGAPAEGDVTALATYAVAGMNGAAVDRDSLVGLTDIAGQLGAEKPGKGGA